MPHRCSAVKILVQFAGNVRIPLHKGVLCSVNDWNEIEDFLALSSVVY